MEEFLEKQIGETEFLFSGRLEIDYLNNKFQLDLPESDVYDTLGGLIIDKLETIPIEGTELRVSKLLLIVDQVSEKKIESVRIKLNA